MSYRLPLNSSTFDDDEINAAVDVLRSGQLTMGALCLQFEDEFARTVGSKNAIFVNSGSSANLLAFFAMANPLVPTSLGPKLEPGSEVIVPAVTWSTTIWPIVQAGAIPVLVDSDPATLQMDPMQVQKAISKKTVAICPVHVLGNSAPLTELCKIAKDHGLWLIEDTCEALGTKHSGKFVGTFGHIGTYSFYFSHHITTVEGGMVVTDNDELADLLRCLRAHGWTRHMRTKQQLEKKHSDIDPRFLFVNTGFNLRPTEINAAFGLKQIKKLSQFNQRRREVAEQWGESFKTLHNDFVPMQLRGPIEATWFGYPVMCRSTELRNRLRDHLEKNGIETRPIICGNLARQPAFKLVQHRVVGDLPGADAIMDRGLFWGSHPMMSANDVKMVGQVVMEFFKH